jgi:hypothetical protein
MSQPLEPTDPRQTEHMHCDCVPNMGPHTATWAPR